MKIMEAGLSDKGNYREVNQDNSKIIILNDHLSIFAVADAIGGLDAGENASSIAISSVVKWAKFGELEKSSLNDEIEDLIKKIHKDIRLYGRGHGLILGTTLMLLLFLNDDLWIVQVGDSKAFYFRKGVEGKVLTTNHSVFVPEKGHSYLSSCFWGGRSSRFLVQIEPMHITEPGYFLLGSDGAFNRLNLMELKKYCLDFQFFKRGCSRKRFVKE
ncbi:PP2C family protein-serine/threonine phosphatase [Eubacterium aggregans]|uniref:PP2C family protein-serine/threonine phosphatase n=1 Tax=Eubacterium aggregans TaxID=81409 RepID=UPI003F3207C6